MIEINNVTLTYNIYRDKTLSLKESVINLFKKDKYTEKNTHFNALENINISIQKNERVGIIGRNGAGKSTLLKVISGILKPTQGFVEVDGTIQPLIEIAAGFNPEFSGRENIYLNGYMLGFTDKQIKEKEKEIIEFSGLEEFIDVPVKYYSSGMAVKLAFTIATSIEPEILVFDEMLSAGDAAFFQKAQDRIKSLVDKAKAVVIVSHDLNLIKTFCSRVLVVDHGKVVFDGNPIAAVQVYLDSIEENKNNQTRIDLECFATLNSENNTWDLELSILTPMNINYNQINLIIANNQSWKLSLDNSKIQNLDSLKSSKILLNSLILPPTQNTISMTAFDESLNKNFFGDTHIKVKNIDSLTFANQLHHSTNKDL